MKRLTDTMLSRMSPPARSVEIRDQQEQGLVIRISPRKVMRWYWVHRRGGKLKRVNLGPFPAVSVAEAREKAREARMEVETGRPARQDLTLQDVFDEWAVDKLRRTVKGEYSVSALRNHVIYDLGKREVRTLTTQDCLRPIRKRIAQGRANMAGVALGLFKELLKYAVMMGYIDASPLADVTARLLGIKRKPRNRVLTVDEMRTIWGSDYESLVVEMLQFLMLSFLRGNEVRLMTWEMIDWDERRIALPSELMKSRRPHDVFITNEMMSILEHRRLMAAGEYVFIAGLKDQPVSRTFIPSRANELRQRHGMSGWAPHDLRRGVSLLVEHCDVNPYVADLLLAHSPGSQIMTVYQRSTLWNERKQALELWERWLREKKIIQS